MVPTIEINGRVYPVRFSVRAAINCVKELGSIERAIFGSEDEAENLAGICFVLHEMLAAGRAWCEAEPGDFAGPLPEVPSWEQLTEMISFRWLTQNRRRLGQIALEEQDAEIGAEAPEEKN